MPLQVRTHRHFSRFGKRLLTAALETLESRQLFAWVGATSGSTSDAAHDYNNTSNWLGGVIDDSFAGATLTANTTLYFSANRTAPGLDLGYNGNFDLAFQSSNATT